LKASSGSSMIAKEDNKRVKTINPATEDVLNEYDIMSKEQIGDVTSKVENTFEQWKKDINRRIDFILDFANELRKNKDSLAKFARQSLCKAIKEVRSEVEKCAWLMEYYADNGQIILRDEVVNIDARKSVITF
jgi:acyl-CoA reductase-like NAD-dependent aldehyde dehydrogenase